MTENFDYLLLRAKENGVPEEALANFPWITWFIWKARNEMVFNEKQIQPPDTIQHAIEEEENWRVAQVMAGNYDGRGSPVNGHTESESSLPRCQVDASWVINSSVVGGGFVFDLPSRKHVYGSVGMEQVLSPLHAEFTILLHAMKSSLQLGYTLMSFYSDCLQLTKLFDNEELWPSVASEWNELKFLLLSFTGFSINFIPRVSNVRADLLAKDAHLQNSIFSHVNSMIPMRLAPKANLFRLN